MHFPLLDYLFIFNNLNLQNLKRFNLLDENFVCSFLLLVNQKIVFIGVSKFKVPFTVSMTTKKLR